MRKLMVVAGALALSCGGTQQQLQKGYTDCMGTTCNPGTYCDVSFCMTGCASEVNCAQGESCVKEGGWTTGTCLSNGGAGGGGGSGGGSGGSGGGSTSCTPRPDGLDGCARNQVCFGDPGPMCVTFSACAAGDMCATGASGSVCNVGYIPNKDKICLTGLCNTASNCPSGWFCVRYPSNNVLGECYQGSPGSLCTKNAECLSGDCAVNPGFPGVCN